MMNPAEESVSNHYNTIGWKIEEGIAVDVRRWEDLREYADKYMQNCRLRVLRHIPERGENILDMASGPIPFEEYLAYSRNFTKRYCVDLSSTALEGAKKKIGSHGVFLQGSFFDIPLEDDFFDCSISLHTIYHIDKDKQEEAVRKLIRVTKSGQPIIIVYSNPDTIIASLSSSPLIQAFSNARNLLKKAKENVWMKLYFYQHPIEWWNRFSDVAHIQILPWRSFLVDDQKLLIPNNKIGGIMFDLLFSLEERFPNFFVKHFQYPMIVLTKNKNGGNTPP